MGASIDIPAYADQVFIGGEWRAAADRLPLENPSTGEIIGEIAAASSEDVDAAVAAARTALDGDWGRTTAAERGRLLTANAWRHLGLDVPKDLDRQQMGLFEEGED